MWAPARVTAMPSRYRVYMLVAWVLTVTLALPSWEDTMHILLCVPFFIFASGTYTTSPGTKARHI